MSGFSEVRFITDLKESGPELLFVDCRKLLSYRVEFGDSSLPRPSLILLLLVLDFFGFLLRCLDELPLGWSGSFERLVDWLIGLKHRVSSTLNI